MCVYVCLCVPACLCICVSVSLCTCVCPFCVYVCVPAHVPVHVCVTVCAFVRAWLKGAFLRSFPRVVGPDCGYLRVSGLGSTPSPFTQSPLPCLSLADVSSTSSEESVVKKKEKCVCVLCGGHVLRSLRDTARF